MAIGEKIASEEASRLDNGLSSFLRTGYLIHDVSRMRRQFYDQQSRHLGITRSQWWVLFNLWRHEGEPLIQNDLARMLEIGSASLGELLARLEKAGFVRRVCDKKDRRSKRVMIAARGEEVLEHMRDVARTNNPLIMAGIEGQDQQTLDKLLSQMKQNLSELLAESANDSDDLDDARLDLPEKTGQP